MTFFMSKTNKLLAKKKLVKAVITALFSEHKKKVKNNFKVYTINQKSDFLVYCGYALIRGEPTMLSSWFI